MTRLMGYSERPSLEAALEYLGIPYQPDEEGVRVRLEDLVHAVPYTYGLGTESPPEEVVEESLPNLPPEVWQEVASLLGLDPSPDR